MKPEELSYVKSQLSELCIHELPKFVFVPLSLFNKSNEDQQQIIKCIQQLVINEIWAARNITDLFLLKKSVHVPTLFGIFLSEFLVEQDYDRLIPGYTPETQELQDIPVTTVDNKI